MLNLGEEQKAAFQAAVKKRIDDGAAKSIAEFDKALDVAVAKLVAEGWTLPADLPIAAINALGYSNQLDDISSFMKEFYIYDDYRNMKRLNL